MMNNLDKVFERNRITKQGIDAMITNYLKLERELDKAQAKITRLKGEAESWEKVFDRTCELLADAKTDAERYQWLRERHENTIMDIYNSIPAMTSPELLDAAIDETMKESK